MSTGQRIKDLRVKRNLTQDYMAERLGITSQGYGKLENDKTEITVSHLKKIAKELGVTVGHLADDEGIIVNNFGEIKEGGLGGNGVVTYHQENIQIVQLLQDELKFWKEKFQQEQDKHQQEVAYYRSMLEKMAGQK